MRCKACNSKMTDEEIVFNTKTGKFNDLCGVCVAAGDDNPDSCDAVDIYVAGIMEIEDGSKS